MAGQSANHRAAFHERLDSIVADLRELRHSERAAVLAEQPAGVLDPNAVRATAMLFGAQVDQAAKDGTLKKDLMADTFRVALWSIGTRLGEEPHIDQLAHLSDARLVVVLARYSPLYT